MDEEKTRAQAWPTLVALVSSILYDVLANRRGRFIGGIFGLVIGFMLYKMGVFWTLVVALTTGIGYYIGQRSDEQREDILDILDRMLPR